VTLLLALAACAPKEDRPFGRDPSTDSGGTTDTGTETDPTETDPDWDDDWAELLERAQAQVDDDGVPGVQLAVVAGGRLRYAGGVGVTEYDGDEAVTADTVFRWASVTKMHTATAVLQLADEGRVDLDAPIATWLPDAHLDGGEDPGDISLRHVLTHTALLEDVLDWECSQSIERRVETYEPYVWAPPGSFYNYSNTGFVWAGRVLEVVDGESFEAVMQRRVLDPAGMETATFDAAEAVSGPHATGTTWWDGAPWYYRLDETDCPWSRPAAWLHGTSTDLARTLEWQLADGGALLPEELALAMRAQADTHYWPDAQEMVGMGLFTYPYKEHSLVMHDGWVTGFVSTWAVIPGTGFGVAVVANADWADPYTLMYDAADLFLDLPNTRWPDHTTDPDTWAPFTGSYDDPVTFGRMTVSLEGSRLYVDLEDLGHRARLTQESEEYFWFQDAAGGWWDVRFIPDEDGVYRWMVNRYAVGERVDPAAHAWAPRAMHPLPPGKPAPERWRSR